MPVETLGKGTTSRFARRQSALRKRFSKLGVSAFLVSRETNVRYLTGFTGHDSQLFMSEHETIFLSDSRFTDQLAIECPDLRVELRAGGESLSLLAAKLADRYAKHGLAIESSFLTVDAYQAIEEQAPSAQIVSTSGEIETLRAVKDSEEIAIIKNAVAIAERAFLEFRATLSAEDSEKELADRIEMLLRKHGGEGSAFAPIVAAGPRAALPHAPPTSQTLGEQSFLLVDWGCKAAGYHSDLTRMLLSRPSKKFERIYEAVRGALEAGIAAIKPGATGSDVDQACRSCLAEAGLVKKFTHGTGHGIGLDVHELPSLRAKSSHVLMPGMIVTVEPGVYVSGWGGIRLEQDVLVTRTGHQVLSNLPLDLESAICPWRTGK